MKKIYPFLAAILFAVNISAQSTINDSASMGASYANAIFYSLDNGVVGSYSIKNADIQFRFQNRSASLRTVDGWGNQTFLPLVNDTTQWASLDTTGMVAVYNADTSWDNGAFNTTSTGHPSYGWGVYNNINHNIYGTKLFVIYTAARTYKKVWIKMLSTVPKIYTIRYANLDGTMDTTVDIGAPDFPGQYFGYYSFDTHTKMSAEPDGTTWDLVFRKYLRSVDHYPVTGALSNINVKTSAIRGLADPYTASGSGLTYISDISNIGTNWKSFTFPAGPWVIEDSAAYFVLTQQGEIWRMVFTGFGGSASGTSYFDKTLLYTGIESVNANLTAATIYPNPGASNSVLVFNNNNGSATQVQIFDMNGALITSQNISTNKGLNQFAIGELNLNRGMYMVQISDGNEKSSLKYVVTY